MGVGEVERSLQVEVRLQDLPRLLADVKKRTSALQRNFALLRELQKVQVTVKTAELDADIWSERFR